MSFWKAFADKYPDVPFLRVDGGSIFTTGVAEAPVVNRWMLEGTARSRLDAVNLTAWDLRVWQELGDMATEGVLPKELLAVPLVSANVTAKVPNYPSIQRYLIRNLKTDPKSPQPTRVGITGVLSVEHESFSPEEFEIEDPQKALRSVIENMKKITDYRIVLTDMDLGKVISLAVVVPGIDLILLAHNYESVMDPQQIGQTLVVMPVNEGRMITEVRINLGTDPAQRTNKTRFIPLDHAVPDDENMKTLLEKAQSEIDASRPGIGQQP